MKNINYGELYKLLYCMQKVHTVTDLSSDMYWSLSKTSKKIKEYEELLEMKLYFKNKDHILSSKGVELFFKINAPYSELKKLIDINSEVIGIDENLIGYKFQFDDKIEIKYLNCSKAIEDYNSKIIDKIVISNDFENQIDYISKEKIVTKDVFKIQKKNGSQKRIFANGNDCPISKKLQQNGIKIDEYLSQSIAICNIVKSGLGIGYTFATQTLDPNDIDIEKIESLQVDFYLYSRK